ncbi:ZP domain-containing protein [Trichonephila inaurata madagascariensis]|uniref:ZP domain-containing protein n=1 Tax=Trichonephila inaurata madagascariensis TaxID=2747483 RepID=A0A8X6XMN7_9ARAC|nr:ZP domain-containing protein [Trichonephila inaurata madagascariensis]
MGRIQMRDPFHGTAYVRDFPFECRAAGDGTRALTIVFGVDKCNTKHTKTQDGESRYEATVYVQFDNNTQRGSDETVRLNCVPRDVMLVSQLGSRPSHTPKIFVGRLDLLSGDTIAQQVTTGEDLTLRITTKQPVGFDVRVVNCVANDGSELNQQLLVDSDGCSMDSNIMKSFERKTKPESTQSILHSTLRVFRFPRRSTLRMRCSVVFCNTTCNPEHCESLEDRKSTNGFDNGVEIVQVSGSVEVLKGKQDLKASPFAAGETMDENLCLNSTRVLVLIAVLLSVLLVSLVVTICTCVRAKELRRRLMERSCSCHEKHAYPSAELVKTFKPPPRTKVRWEGFRT